MTINKNLFLSILLASYCTAAMAAGPVYDVIPLSGIKVFYEGLKYSNIVLNANEAGTIVENAIPQGQHFNIVIEKPRGFVDSAGYIEYGLELKVVGNNYLFTISNDIYAGNPLQKMADLDQINAGILFDKTIKPKTKLTIKGKVFDKRGKGYISFAYEFEVLPASKRLPNKVINYSNYDSKGMHSNSAGLRFNYFEFNGLTGNNFLYRIKKDDDINFTLKGLIGWKLKDAKIIPVGEMVLLDAEGNTLEQAKDVLNKTVGAEMDADKKEIEVKYKPKVKLSAGSFYYAWFKLRDGNSKSNALDVVVKIYVE